MAYRKEFALEVVDYRRERIQYLIDHGVIHENGDFLEMEDVYVQFFEDVLDMNEEISVAKLFEQCIGTVRLLFVSRYPQSIYLRSWLQKIPNRYVHFGDFDHAGINIFLTEFHAHLGARSSFLIPQGICPYDPLKEMQFW